MNFMIAKISISISCTKFIRKGKTNRNMYETNSRYTGVTPAPPPGNTHTSPSEDYWAQVDLNGARQAVNLVNGVIVDGALFANSKSPPS